MGGKASKSTAGNERELEVRLPQSERRPSTKSRARKHDQSPGAPAPASSRTREKQGKQQRVPAIVGSHHARQPRPWTPGAPPSTHSTAYTESVADSARYPDTNSGQRSALRSSRSSSSHSSEFPDVPVHPQNKMAERPSQQHRQQGSAGNEYGSGRGSLQYQRLPEKDRRIIEAEKILGEIAKEYAAKRAAGLVPTKPVPARTLLWEEMAKNRAQAGRRGQCIFGRDTDNICGCTTYKKKRIPGQENKGGVCECCNHGAPWHRLVGGNMARSSRMSRSIIGGSIRASRLESGSYVPSEARSSTYDYDEDSDEDEDDEDEEDIANEMAVPSGFQPPVQVPPPALLQTQLSSHGGIDRASLLSMGSSYGFPSRLSSATNSLGALLQAIQRYREMGLDEDEIEARIREDFPPVPRKSSVAARSDISQSQVDV